MLCEQTECPQLLNGLFDKNHRSRIMQQKDIQCSHSRQFYPGNIHLLFNEKHQDYFRHLHRYFCNVSLESHNSKTTFLSQLLLRTVKKNKNKNLNLKMWDISKPLSKRVINFCLYKSDLLKTLTRLQA